MLLFYQVRTPCHLQDSVTENYVTKVSIMFMEEQKEATSKNEKHSTHTFTLSIIIWVILEHSLNNSGPQFPHSSNESTELNRSSLLLSCKLVNLKKSIVKWEPALCRNLYKTELDSLFGNSLRDAILRGQVTR